MKIGVITALKPIKSTQFYCRLNLNEENKPVNMIQIDDIVKIKFSYNNLKADNIIVYGIISDIEIYWDSNDITGFKEDLINEGNIIAFPVYLAKINVLRILQEKGEKLEDVNILIPPKPSVDVFLVSKGETNIALGFDKLLKKQKAVPIGILPNEAIAYFDTDYILGNNGAHINISGVSGVAAKTSYATFLLYSLMNKVKDARAIVFNVKGDSLLYLDKKNKEFFDNEDKEKVKTWHNMFLKMNLDIDVFKNVKKYIPFNYNSIIDDEVDKFEGKVCGFGWDILDIIDLSLIDLMFDPDELFTNVNLQLAVYTLIDVLQENFDKLKFQVSKALNKKDISLDEIKRYLFSLNTDIEITLFKYFLPLTMTSFIDMIKDKENKFKDKLREEDLEDLTVKALIRRLKAARKLDINRLWKNIANFYNIFQDSYKSPCYKINWNRKGGLTVIDISKLRYRGQVFTIGAVLREVLKSKEEGFVKAPVFIFIDELNKYAPRQGGGPLAALFRDIAERGRSFSVILIGAQQTASGVDYRVITQSSNLVVGNQKLAELKKDEYMHLVAGQKEKASYLLSGQMLISQPHFKVPLLINFPLTPWATRSDYIYYEHKGDIDIKDLF